MVGNGVCDTAFDGNDLVPFAHGMGLISDDIYQVNQTALPSLSNRIGLGFHYYTTDICFKTFI